MERVHTMALLEEIALECYRKEAVPMMIVSSDSYVERVFDEIPASTLATTPKHLVAMVKECDMYIGVEEFDDPQSRRSPRGRSCRPDKRRTFLCTGCSPTRRRARNGSTLVGPPRRRPSTSESPTASSRRS